MPNAAAHPSVALTGLLQRVDPVDTEEVDLEQASGRVLAAPVVADRESPPHDVSAMDGYAVRLSDLGQHRLAIAGEIAMGAAPLPLPPGQALRIMTGACVPAEAEAVVMREDVTELGDALELTVDASTVRTGQHIRRRGENLGAGSAVVDAGRLVTPAVAGACSTFGAARVAVRQRVRVSALVTGDEVLSASQPVAPYQIRDANGAALQSLLTVLPWAKLVRCVQVRDDLSALVAQLELALADSDAVWLTGGVSMGTRDYVPEAVQRAGGSVAFHRLKIRPGKPILGALGPQGQVVLGLPGNPVSVVVGARWFGLPLLQQRAGLSPAVVPPTEVRLRNPGRQTLHLWWFRPVRIVARGEAELTPSRGSGDMVSAARSDGFVLIPPEQAGPGPWPYYGWTS